MTGGLGDVMVWTLTIREVSDLGRWRKILENKPMTTRSRAALVAFAMVSSEWVTFWKRVQKDELCCKINDQAMSSKNPKKPEKVLQNI